jgi:hypothetical protein
MKIVGYLLAGLVGLVALLSVINFFGLAALTKESYDDINVFEDYED